jgi:hypothetical protein
LISQVRKLLTASQSWFVVSIVGELISLHRSSGANSKRKCILMTSFRVRVY